MPVQDKQPNENNERISGHGSASRAGFLFVLAGLVFLGGVFFLIAAVHLSLAGGRAGEAYVYFAITALLFFFSTQILQGALLRTSRMQAEELRQSSGDHGLDRLAGMTRQQVEGRLAENDFLRGEDGWYRPKEISSRKKFTPCVYLDESPDEEEILESVTKAVSSWAVNGYTAKKSLKVPKSEVVILFRNTLSEPQKRDLAAHSLQFSSGAERPGGKKKTGCLPVVFEESTNIGWYLRVYGTARKKGYSYGCRFVEKIFQPLPKRTETGKPAAQ
jgi:hypothetical protein